VNCCYANQTKFWVIDPDGVEWEVYHVNFDLVEKHGIRESASHPAKQSARRLHGFNRPSRSSSFAVPY
jgi:hypothetical protein